MATKKTPNLDKCDTCGKPGRSFPNGRVTCVECFLDCVFPTDSSDAYKDALEHLLNACSWAHKKDGKDFPNPTDAEKLLLQLSMISAYRALNPGNLDPDALKDSFAERTWRAIKSKDIESRPSKPDSPTVTVTVPQNLPESNR